LLNRNIRNNLPDDALITTYTYDPLIGVTSQTDPNGLATYYEYDDFGQLTAVKNSDNKLVSSHVYHYAEQPVSPQLSVAQTSLSFGSATSTQNVSVSSNISWTVSDNTSWISESPASGSGNGTVGISCSTNTSTNYRNGTVTITGGGISKTVNISQAGAIPPEYLNVSPLNILFNEYSSSHYVLVDSNVNWTVSNNVFWLSVSPSSGSNVGSFKIQSQTNLGLGSRNGTITVSGGGITKVINITQKGNSGDL
jgi:YD repeat-containing protein